MKAIHHFIVRSILFIAAAVAVMAGIFALANGYTDPFYLRFTGSTQQSMILGSSRAAQGIQPEVIRRVTGVKGYNFSFTIDHSPYGPTYLDAISRKLDPETRNGLFILSVDPWSLSAACADPNNPEQFPEQELCLGNTKQVTGFPNYTYLYHNLSGHYMDILLKRKSSMLLHEDGWLEVKVDLDTAVVAKRIAAKREDYLENNLPRFKPSLARLYYLIRTIRLLHMHGRVYLVRLPVHARIAEIDQRLMPDFNQTLARIIPMTDGYLDLSASTLPLTYVDGNHLAPESGSLVSEQIGTWINNQSGHTGINHP